MFKYPIERSRYVQSVGRLLVHRLGQIFRELGFTSEITEGQENGVDIKVFTNDGQPVLVAEVLNWSPVSLLSSKRISEIINNLNSYDCPRFLIYTCMKNENVLYQFVNNGIFLWKIGYQLLPKRFYDFFAKKKQIESRRKDCKESEYEITSLIIDILDTIDSVILIHPPESVVQCEAIT